MIKKFTLIFWIMLILASCSSVNHSDIIHSEKESRLTVKEEIPLGFFLETLLLLQ